jgi:hypothetical protein
MDKGKQMRFTDEELNLVKNTFKGNERLVKLLRKVFLPEYDPNAPVGQVIDLWMTLDLANLSEQEREVRLFARNGLIMHVEQQLMQLQVLAELPEDGESTEEKRKKDSAK